MDKMSISNGGPLRAPKTDTRTDDQKVSIWYSWLHCLVKCLKYIGSIFDSVYSKQQNTLAYIYNTSSWRLELQGELPGPENHGI